MKKLLSRYYWLTKPGIIYGNDLSAVAGFLLASSIKKHFDLGLFAATIAGISLVIACGCVLNNLMDRKIDAKMARTRKRALVTGKVSPQAARIYGVALGVAGFTLLLAFVNQLTAAIGAVGLFFYLVMYGWAKRHTHFSTLIGSVSGATPIAAGYTAVTNHIDSGAIILFLSMVFWQMPHFYAIAIYRYQDYKEAGLPVLSVKKGMRRAKFESLIYIAFFTVTAGYLTVFKHAGYAYMAIMVSLGFYWLSEGLASFKKPDADWGRHMFRFSLVVLLVFCVMVSLGRLLP